MGERDDTLPARDLPQRGDGKTLDEVDMQRAREAADHRDPETGPAAPEDEAGP